MSKSHLFTLFLTVIMALIVGEVLSNDYLGDKLQQGDVGAAVIGALSDVSDMAGQTQGAATEQVPDDTGSAPLAGGSSSAQDSEGQLSFEINSSFPTESFVPKGSVVLPDVLLSPAITFEIVEEAGFQDVTLQRVPFSGILFGIIDLRDFKTVDVVEQNLLQANRSKIATFSEFHSGSELLANEVYLLLKERAGGVENVSVNETNEFGDGSFYVNRSAEPGSAFLVVKNRESVYALAYQKGLHLFITSLLQ